MNAKRPRRTRIVVGTAGWTVPRRYLQAIPAGGTHLERYARSFAGVEINSSFYRPHQLKTYVRWARSVGRDFRFSVKTPRTLIQDGALVCGRDSGMDDFLEEVAGLGSRLRVLLVQLPPKLAFDPVAARRFFRQLQRRTRRTTAIVCEPRHPSWGSAVADQLLRTCRVARAAVDPPRWGQDSTPGGDTRIAYFRMHGSPRIYYSAYDSERLERLHATLEQWSRRSAQVWCIFDNTAHGHATGNALALQESLR